MSNNITKAINILRNLNNPSRIINRDRINFNKLMTILGNPQNQFKSIHVTGTNGKGSVSLKTAKILQNAGYKVGLYTSPHLFTFRQRIQINGQKISQQQIAQKIIYIQQISKIEDLALSYFQYLTAAGFLYFKQQKCQYVSLEVGLGGKNDTTNIVYPEISVLASIGLDHTELLGPTKEHIARQKSGIIKRQRPVVLGPSAQNYQSIQQAIKQNNCKVFKVPPQSYDHNDFQSQNNAISTVCIKALQYCNPNLKITQQHIRLGLLAKQPCRMQLLKQQYLPKWSKDKKIYFDVGHNPQAINKVKQYIQKLNIKKDQISFIFGTSRGKKFQESLAQIQQICGFIYLIQAKHFRACKVTNLQSYIGMAKNPHKYRCIADGDITKTLSYVVMDPYCKVIVVSGSFFIMPQARGYFQPELIAHPQENINQIYQLNQQNQVKI